ncbi:copia protein [Tanacetum coccineum]|uniref:Copia protein n=1 Tax=Tanacetum coccineum TaxID=301880 RepID=A0ABQ4X1L9_9ASTR
MERGFLRQKGSGVGRGVKEKDLNRNKMNTTSGTSSSTELDDTMNEDTHVVVATAATKTATTPVVDMTVEKDKRTTLDDTTVEKEKLSSLEDITVLGSIPPLPTQVTTSVGNAPGKSSYANITGKPSRKKVNVRTLFTPEGNGIDVVVPKVAYLVVANYVRNTWGKYGLICSMFSSSTGLFSFQFSSMDGLDAMLENGPWFIRNNPLILKKWHPDENLLKEDVSTVPIWVKLHGVPVTAFSEDGLSAIAIKLGTPLMLDSYTSDMCMQSWGRSSYARVMIELRADMELKDNIVVAKPKITREGHYTCASEKKTVKKPSQTSRGKIRLLDNDGNPLVPTGIVKSDSEVEVVFDETANLRISTSYKDGSDKGYGTNSLLEQWRDSYQDNDDYDLYDDDMYENHDLSEHLQSICDDLDITVRGRKKK